MTSRMEINNFRMTAAIVGIMYLVGFVVGIGGTIMIQSTLDASDRLASISRNNMTLAIGAVLWLIAVVGDAAHGVLMFPILKQHSERMAVGYLAARIVDAVFIAVMVLFVLIQIPLGNESLKAVVKDASYLQALSNTFAQAQLYTYEIGMSALGVSGLVLCYTFFKAKLVPKWLAVWGFAGYATILLGMLSAIMGSGLGDVSSILGGLWEVFVGVWLIVKGFNSSEIASGAG